MAEKSAHPSISKTKSYQIWSTRGEGEKPILQGGLTLDPSPYFQSMAIVNTTSNISKVW
jgi:hypothetical protein